MPSTKKLSHILSVVSDGKAPEVKVRNHLTTNWSRVNSTKQKNPRRAGKHCTENNPAKWETPQVVNIPQAKDKKRGENIYMQGNAFKKRKEN